MEILLQYQPKHVPADNAFSTRICRLQPESPSRELLELFEGLRGNVVGELEVLACRAKLSSDMQSAQAKLVAQGVSGVTSQGMINGAVELVSHMQPCKPAASVVINQAINQLVINQSSVLSINQPIECCDLARTCSHAQHCTICSLAPHGIVAPVAAGVCNFVYPGMLAPAVCCCFAILYHIMTAALCRAICLSGDLYMSEWVQYSLNLLEYCHSSSTNSDSKMCWF